MPNPEPPNPRSGGRTRYGPATCQGCGTTILCGFGVGPIAEHYQPDFAQKVANYRADQLQVNDC